MLNQIKQSKLKQLLAAIAIMHLLTWVAALLRHHNSEYKSSLAKDLLELNCVLIPVITVPYVLYYFFIHRSKAS